MIFIPLRPYDGFPLLNRAPDIHVLPRGILSDNTGLSYIASFFFHIAFILFTVSDSLIRQSLFIQSSIHSNSFNNTGNVLVILPSFMLYFEMHQCSPPFTMGTHTHAHANTNRTHIHISKLYSFHKFFSD